MRRALPTAFLFALALGCARSSGPAPVVDRVEPPAGGFLEPVSVTLVGTGFAANVHADLDRPTASTADATFQAFLEAGGESVSLGEVTLVDARTVTAVVPAHLAAGKYGLLLVDPRGREARLADAYSVEAVGCPDWTGVFCVVDGGCFVAGAANPANACLQCDPPTAQDAWAPQPEDLPCDDLDLCTQGEACHAGLCGAPATVTTCVPDACHPAGSCDPATGLCPAALADGAACDDGDGCTAGETCNVGQCGAPTTVTTCVPDACHPAGSCNPATGLCPAALADGTLCDDSDGCTVGEACHAGLCGSPTSLVTCPADVCHPGGTCDPDGGTCPSAYADGKSCDDMNACTLGEACHGGACGQPTSVVSCPTVVCNDNVCDPDAGVCVATPTAGSPGCDDHNICSSPDTCQAGVCRGAPVCAVNTAPRACLVVTPNAGPVGVPVSFSAICSDDVENMTAELQARFDFEGDGAWDTAFGLLTATHVYPDAGFFEAVVEVLDTGGLSMFAERFVSVASPLQDVVVTTALDESTPLASPADAGGTGLSLREAIAFATSTGIARTIRFAGPMTIAPTTALPSVNVSGTAIVGSPGVVVDFSAVPGTPNCLTLNAAGQWLLGIALGGCGGPLLQVKGATDRVAECSLGLGARNIDGAIVTGNAAVFGPRNDVSGFAGDGVKVTGPNVSVTGNRVHGNLTGIRVPNGGDTASVTQNFIYGNSTLGLYTTLTNPSPKVLHNTFASNGTDGLQAANSAGTPLVQDNIFAGNGGFGVRRQNSGSINEDHNLFFGNTSGPITPGGVGAAAVLTTPLFLGAAVGDFRLAPASPAVNVGTDGGLDVNGPRNGQFDGPTSDLGAWESPY